MFNKKLNYYFICSLLFLILLSNLYLVAKTNIEFFTYPNSDTKTMYDAFNITIDQLEGEINLPYVYERTDEYQRIRVAHSLLGGFTQFRINYQYIYYPSDAYLEDVTSEGFVHDGFIQTSRTIVPRGTPPTPPLPPPVNLFIVF